MRTELHLSVSIHKLCYLNTLKSSASLKQLFAHWITIITFLIIIINNLNFQPNDNISTFSYVNVNFTSTT